MTKETETQPFSPLIASVLTQRANESADLANSVQRMLEKQRDIAEAKVAIIQVDIRHLFESSLYMPQPDVILNRLHPAEWKVEQYIETGKCGWLVYNND